MKLPSKIGTQQQWELCRSLLALFCLVLTLLCSATPVSAKTRVSDIRIGVHPEKTRTVVELSSVVEIRKIFFLSNPYRLVIDLPEIEWALPPGKSSTGAGIIEGFRFGHFRAGTGRIVLDLGGAAEIAARFILPADGDNPWRLVIDLVSISTEKFATAARARVAALPAPPARKPQVVPAPHRPEDKRVIVIDAGHGGVDPGATGLSGTHEKEVVLDYALELRRQLGQNNLYEILLTRQKDEFLPLRARGEIAVTANADLFLSLHVNTDSSSSTAGFSVYTLSEKASDAEVAALAAKENKSDVMAGMDLEQYDDLLANILIDLAQSKTNEISVEFARDSLVREVRGEFKILSRPWRVADFGVLKAPNVPSVLIELGYVSNRGEERRLLSRSYRRKLCAAIVRSIDRYFTTANQAR